jgi:hypothetical protein
MVVITKQNCSPISCVETSSCSVSKSSKASAVNAPKHLFINAEITDLEGVGEVEADEDRCDVQ